MKRKGTRKLTNILRSLLEAFELQYTDPLESIITEKKKKKQKVVLESSRKFQKVPESSRSKYSPFKL